VVWEDSLAKRASAGRRSSKGTAKARGNEHELIEEQVLYPALEPHAQAREIVLEGYEEHHVADVVTKELHDVTPDDERWAAKFKVLKESLEHHIQEEERRMFRTARGVLSRDELNELGKRMKALKAESRG
jgi:hemerythrin-like domain-containing protein